MMSKPKILLIDDEQDILEVVSILLASEGLDVDTAPNGKAAIKMMAEKTYQVVVSDYLMPKMDGIELLKHVRATSNHTPFIFFSGHADETHEVKMSGMGAYALLPKSQLKNLSQFIWRTVREAEEVRNVCQEGPGVDLMRILNAA